MEADGGVMPLQDKGARGREDGTDSPQSLWKEQLRRHLDFFPCERTNSHCFQWLRLWYFVTETLKKAHTHCQLMSPHLRGGRGPRARGTELRRASGRPGARASWTKRRFACRLSPQGSNLRREIGSFSPRRPRLGCQEAEVVGRDVFVAQN